MKPTVGGGIPSDIPRLELKLTFKEGGHDAFQNKFEVMKERLSYARTLQQETGQIIPTGEDLPQYEATAPKSSDPSALSTATTRTASDTKEREALDHFSNSQEQQTPGSDAARVEAVSHGSALSEQTNPAMPDEPPPDYEEAQAQAIGMRFEESAREAADQK